MRRNPAEICRKLQAMARGAGKTVGTPTLAKVQGLQLEVTDLKMDLEVLTKKLEHTRIDLVEANKTIEQYEHVPF